LEEQSADLGRCLAQYYGCSVAVEYVDTSSPTMVEYPNLLLLVRQRNLPLPVITLNGKPRFAGGISLEKITEELEKLGAVPLEQSSGG
jgi:hypothetical protein